MEENSERSYVFMDEGFKGSAVYSFMEEKVLCFLDLISIVSFEVIDG